MSSNDDPERRDAEGTRPARRFTFWHLLAIAALFAGGTAGLALWYFNSASADRLSELSPQDAGDVAALIITGVMLLAITVVLTALSVSVIRDRYR